MHRNHLVNDLAWAIHSPPLMIISQPDCHWYRSEFYNELFSDSKQWFDALEQDSSQLQRVIDAQKDKRMGNYFETLWAYWIECSERFELIERNLQIFENGITLGELDFIVFDRETKTTLHWELAIKFYLGVGDTSLHKNWHGPAKKDRLDLKIDHLLNHQTLLCQHPATQKVLQAKNIQVDGSAVILKGCLFYPVDEKKCEPPVDVNSNHCRSRWMGLAELETHFNDDVLFLPLIGVGWMADVGDGRLAAAHGLTAIVSAIEGNQYRLPLLLAVLDNGRETEKVFVVQKDWADSLI